MKHQLYQELLAIAALYRVVPSLGSLSQLHQLFKWLVLSYFTRVIKCIPQKPLS